METGEAEEGASCLCPTYQRCSEDGNASSWVPPEVGCKRIGPLWATVWWETRLRTSIHPALIRLACFGAAASLNPEIVSFHLSQPGTSPAEQPWCECCICNAHFGPYGHLYGKEAKVEKKGRKVVGEILA